MYLLGEKGYNSGLLLGSLRLFANIDDLVIFLIGQSTRKTKASVFGTYSRFRIFEFTEPGEPGKSINRSKLTKLSSTYAALTDK